MVEYTIDAIKATPKLLGQVQLSECVAAGHDGALAFAV
jgi:hypothetical protein